MASKYPTIDYFQGVQHSGDFQRYILFTASNVFEQDIANLQREMIRFHHSIRKQIKKADNYIHKFGIDIAGREALGDAPPELIASWRTLHKAMNDENRACEAMEDHSDMITPLLWSTIGLKRRVDAGEVYLTTEDAELVASFMKVLEMGERREGFLGEVEQAQKRRLDLEVHVMRLKGGSLDPSKMASPL